ncbi:dockerin type I domain-containing protein [uncultured Desulfobacter sp.]|uniref:dockerin type I domain-containing protein n=1 Tax=uncultured Desulfobacter sp. TaxID=240139 RepID=UPI002AAB22A0|nr:dockerin type I domain-containing protein [uncultured Desulfobacter sp.]
MKQFPPQSTIILYPPHPLLAFVSRRAIRFKRYLTLFFAIAGILAGVMTFPLDVYPAAYSLGDTNGDGEITAVDAAIIFQIAENSLAGDSEQQSAADANEDGAVTETDARMVLAWAAQGIGVNPPDYFTELADLPVSNSASSTIGTAGGAVVLSSGVTVSLPAGQLSDSIQIGLYDIDPASVDSIGNKTCFEISPDISYYPGATLSIPCSNLTGNSGRSSAIEGVMIVYYDRWTRRYNHAVVDYTVQEDQLTIDLNQIRDGDTVSLAQDSKLLVFIVGASATVSAYSTRQAFGTAEIVKLDYVPYYEQGNYGYCWAACTAMAVNYFRVRLGEKPWDPADYLEIDDDAGFAALPAWLGISEFKNYIHLATGVTPEVNMWLSSASLSSYLKGQIDAGRPVLMSLPARSHQVLIVGYEADATGTITHVIHHDPADCMYKKELWDAVMVFWGTLISDAVPCPKAIFTTIIPKTSPDYTDGISINLLGHKEPSASKRGLTFKSPMQDKGYFPDAELRFAWHVGETHSHGMVNCNENSLLVTTIPNYYDMDLRLRVANTSSDSPTIKADWLLINLDGEEDSGYAGEEENIAVRQFITDEVNMRPVFRFQQFGFDGLSGNYMLTVSASNTTTGTTYDNIKLNLAFDQGIALSALKTQNTSTGNQVAQLTWNAYSGQFDNYCIYRITGSSWIKIAEVNSDTTEYKDTSADLSSETLYYGVAVIKDDHIVITSDVAGLESTTGILAYQDYATSTIYFSDLTSGDSWFWAPDTSHIFHLVGVTPAGLVVVIDENMIVTRTSWGKGTVTYLTGYECTNDDTVSVKNDGTIIFHGNAGRYTEGLYSLSPGETDPVPIFVDLYDDADFDPVYAYEVAVAKNSSADKIVFEADNDSDETCIWAVNESGGTAIPLTTNYSEDLQISDDGSRCLFQTAYTSDAYHVGTISAHGGEAVDLDMATGLEVDDDGAISPDGTTVCTMAMTSDHQTGGIAAIKADGSSYQWLPLGTIMPGSVGRMHYSRDGLYILFDGIDAASPDPIYGYTTDIYKIRVDGSESPVNLTNTPSVNECNPFLN